DRRAVRLVLDDRAHEAGRLDHLEIVVAHRVARGRLERPELTVRHADQPGLPGGVLVVLVETQPQLAEAPEVPRQRTLVAVDLDAIGALLPDRDPARRQGSAGAAGEAQQRRRVVLVLDRCRLTALGPREV